MLPSEALFKSHYIIEGAQCLTRWSWCSYFGCSGLAREEAVKFEGVFCRSLQCGHQEKLPFHHMLCHRNTRIMQVFNIDPLLYWSKSGGDWNAVLLTGCFYTQKFAHMSIKWNPSSAWIAVLLPRPSWNPMVVSQEDEKLFFFLFWPMLLYDAIIINFPPMMLLVCSHLTSTVIMFSGMRVIFCLNGLFQWRRMEK